VPKSNLIPQPGFSHRGEREHRVGWDQRSEPCPRWTLCALWFSIGFGTEILLLPDRPGLVILAIRRGGYCQFISHSQLTFEPGPHKF